MPDDIYVFNSRGDRVKLAGFGDFLKDYGLPIVGVAGLAGQGPLANLFDGGVFKDGKFNSGFLENVMPIAGAYFKFSMEKDMIEAGITPGGSGAATSANAAQMVTGMRDAMEQERGQYQQEIQQLNQLLAYMKQGQDSPKPGMDTNTMIMIGGVAFLGMMMVMMKK